MLINWKGDGILAVQPIDVEPVKLAQKIPNRKEREEELRVITVNADPVIITPGWNEVPDEVWNLCRDHLKQKIIDEQIVELSKEETDDKRVKTFRGMTITDFKQQNATNGIQKLLSIVADCNNVANLKNWIEIETRDGVLKEMKIQLEKLTSPPTEEE